MTLQESKAWFEGFTECMDSTPNEKQWKRIQKRVGEINGETTTYPIYIDRYVRPYNWPQWTYTSGDTLTTVGSNKADNVSNFTVVQPVEEIDFASAGRAEYASV